MNDEAFMALALEQAKKAAAMGEVPVGAVVAEGGRVVCAAHNLCERDGSPLRHAEMIAIEEACSLLGEARLTRCALYVTLEPCAMCAGAIIGSRMGRLVYGAADEAAGCAGGAFDLFALPFAGKIAIKSGVLAEECSALLSDFFKSVRQ